MRIEIIKEGNEIHEFATVSANNVEEKDLELLTKVVKLCDKFTQEAIKDA